MSDKPTRRQFLKGCARVAGAAAVGAVALKLTARADADKVWQLDPKVCSDCGKCALKCVLKQSAVRAVNNFDECGYCRICPAYFDTTSRENEDGTFDTLVCPRNAMRRRLVGKSDPDDPNNNYYEYTIDESLCNGCGLCVARCKPNAGNGALHLQVRHDLCRDCNQCSIATACPPQAFYRARLADAPAGYRRSRSKGAKA
jgi:Na+-translocating ferredoxin:NAD+ oxidoreductase subunit B